MMLFGDIIFTPRLRLRRINLNDLGLLISWSNSETAHGAYLSPDRMSEKTGKEKLETGALWAEKNKTFIITTHDGMPIGTIHYWLRPERKECAVVKVKISEPGERNKGYGTEAQKYLIINLFERLKVKEVEMYTDINNKAQQRCLGKLGFNLVNSLTYEDHRVNRLGLLFKLPSDAYRELPVYQYHYE